MQAVVVVLGITLLTANKKSQIDELTHLINTQTDKIINLQAHKLMNS